MKSLRTYADLTDYGLCPLTGEADAYGRRILCDLSQAGLILMTAYLGLAHTKEAGQAFPANWNSTVGGQPAVASVLLARDLLTDLMVFSLLHVDQYDYVLQVGGDLTGFNGGERMAEYFQDYAEGHPTCQLFRNFCKVSTAPSVEGRNVHAMSGRIV